MAVTKSLRLVYIHGFQGDETSFQSFPTDLHRHLLGIFPTDVELNSCLYPTYKSRRPIAEATQKFLRWLEQQSSGSVILLAHSMGGLLAAEAATDKSAMSKRIIGVVNFDVPFLGMHPHVIVSGIASLLPKGKKKSESEMNDQKIVKIEHDDDADTAVEHVSSPSSPDNRYTHSSPATLSGSQLDLAWEEEKASYTRSESDLDRDARNRQSPSSSPSPSRFSSFTSFVTSSLSKTSAPSFLNTHISKAEAQLSSLQKQVSSLPSRVPKHIPYVSPRLTQTATALLQPLLPPALARGLREHADDPLRAAATYIVEQFEFGSCMFDPPELRERYAALERWDGHWVNLWTEVPARSKSGAGATATAARAEPPEDTAAAGVIPDSTAQMAALAETEAADGDERAHAEARKRASASLRQERADERAHPSSSARPARHFIVLPHARGVATTGLHFGSREKWEKVQIEGVEDEVGAHCALFIPSQNTHYKELIERVAGLIVEWYQ